MATAPSKKAELQQEIRGLESTLESTEQKHEDSSKLSDEARQYQNTLYNLQSKQEHLGRIQKGLQALRHSILPDEKRLAVLVCC